MNDKSFFKSFLAASLITLFIPAFASATGATLVMKSGLRIYVNNGYEKIVDGFETIDKDARHKIVSLDIEGGIFLLDLSELVLVCKEKCTSISIVDTRDPARGR